MPRAEPGWPHIPEITHPGAALLGGTEARLLRVSACPPGAASGCTHSCPGMAWPFPSRDRGQQSSHGQQRGSETSGRMDRTGGRVQEGVCLEAGGTASREQGGQQSQKTREVTRTEAALGGGQGVRGPRGRPPRQSGRGRARIPEGQGTLAPGGQRLRPGNKTERWGPERGSRSSEGRPAASVRQQGRCGYSVTRAVPPSGPLHREEQGWPSPLGVPRGPGPRLGD